MAQLILGIDDAGRGPIIGSMALAGVLIDEKQEATFKKKGIKDSKQVPHQDRIKLEKYIKSNSYNSKVILISPEEIDSSINSGINLNTIDARKIAEIINSLTENLKQEIKVIVDCPSPNTKIWRSTLLNYIKNPGILDLKCEHKADSNHISVGAASIIAKVARENEISKIKKQYKQYGDIGSGYASDPITKEFLKNHGSTLQDSGLFRKTWSTWTRHLAEKQQKKLPDF